MCLAADILRAIDLWRGLFVPVLHALALATLLDCLYFFSFVASVPVFFSKDNPACYSSSKGKKFPLGAILRSAVIFSARTWGCFLIVKRLVFVLISGFQTEF